jgi:hypothetical protein
VHIRKSILLSNPNEELIMIIFTIINEKKKNDESLMETFSNGMFLNKPIRIIVNSSLC